MTRFDNRQTEVTKDEWLTPPEIVAALGKFDLDPCAPHKDRRPWSTAAKHISLPRNGLDEPWVGRVWCNPPYGAETGKWLEKMAKHANGVALIFARTDTKMFFDHVFPKAQGLLFIKGRLHFHHVDGSKAKLNAGAPSVLVAYGRSNLRAFRESGIEGHVVDLEEV